MGVQRLHAAVHHLGETRHLLDRNHGDPALPEGLGGATGGHDLPAERDQLPGELHDAALVRHRQQGSGLYHVSATARIKSARLTTSFRSTTSTGEWEYRSGQPSATATTPYGVNTDPSVPALPEPTLSATPRARGARTS